MNSLAFKEPTALHPITMPLLALAMVPVHVAVNGLTREADEGTTAHIFQVLIVALFAFTWIPQRPMWAIRVLAFQLVAVFAAIAAVYFFTSQLCEFRW